MMQIDRESLEKIANNHTAFLTILNDLEKCLPLGAHKARTHCQRLKVILDDNREQFKKFTVEENSG